MIRLVLWNEPFGKRVRKGGWEEIDGSEGDQQVVVMNMKKKAGVDQNSETEIDKLLLI